MTRWLSSTVLPTEEWVLLAVAAPFPLLPSMACRGTDAELELLAAAAAASREKMCGAVEIDRAGLGTVSGLLALDTDR